VVHQPPHIDGSCDRCGGSLVQRHDDRAESVTVRMKAYEESTAPLIRFYDVRRLLVRVPASGSPAQILDRSLVLLKRTAPPSS
jgi:adenylate kinase